jgi:hypothetical protein
MTNSNFQTGYKVKQLGSLYCVVYIFADGEEMIMVNKYFKTVSGAEKALQKTKFMAGAL